MSPQLVTVVACGAPLAARVSEVAAVLMEAGRTVSVVATPSAMAWIDSEAVSRVVGHAPRVDYRSPSEPKLGLTPDAVVVCPMTFNSLNKVVAGIADTYALGVMDEALGQRLPVLAIPMVNDRLWGHPAWAANLEVLSEAGVTLIDVHTGHPGARAVVSGTGSEVVERFNPTWVRAAVEAALAIA